MSGGEGDPIDPQRWLQYAEDELQLATTARAASSRASVRESCWHSQQAAEKAIKALLLLTTGRFERSHRLAQLADLLPEPWAGRIPRQGLLRLSVWYIESRYPGDYPEPTSADAAEAEAIARTVYDAVVNGFAEANLVTE